MTVQMGKEGLWQLRRQNGAVIAAHRGTNGGNIIQNTLLAYECALQMGADMVEMDVTRSRDGVFFASHSTREQYLVGKDVRFETLSAKEIEAFQTINSLGEKVGQKVERVSYILPRLKGRCYINIDRSWFYWRETIEELRKYGMEDQILLKCPVKKKFLQQLQDSGFQVMYMPIVYTLEDWQMVRSFPGINTVAAELIFDRLDHPLVSKQFLAQMKQEEILPWANVITLKDNTWLTGGLDDNHAIAESYQDNWGRLIEMGFGILQTDWPALLRKYLLSRKVK